jgi:ribonuclease P protein component, eubacterial
MKAPTPVTGEFFPKTKRLLKPREFRVVYDRGERIAGRTFVAFCWQDVCAPDVKIGFTTPRALGKAVRRNRMRRRVREAFRRRLVACAPGWRIVVNLRQAAHDAPHAQIVQEVEKVLARCAR